MFFPLILEKVLCAALSCCTLQVQAFKLLLGKPEK